MKTTKRRSIKIDGQDKHYRKIIDTLDLFRWEPHFSIIDTLAKSDIDSLSVSQIVEKLPKKYSRKEIEKAIAELKNEKVVLLHSREYALNILTINRVNNAIAAFIKRIP